MPLALVTGGTGGVGFETALGLARAGYEVVLTGRSAARGAEAVSRLQRTVPGAAVTSATLELGDLGGVAAFAAGWQLPLDLLVNNAGLIGRTVRQVTTDGFEQQFGANYLGHFALTLRLLPRLLEAGQPRVVSVSSLAHRSARIAFDDLQSERDYGQMQAYGQSKLAMLMFARELQRRATARGWNLRSTAAHPGWAATGIVANGFGGLRGAIAQAGFSLLAQSAADGAKPILYAALAPDAEPGGYYGPSRWNETRGPVAPARVMPQARDETAAERLWVVSETLSNVKLPS